MPRRTSKKEPPARVPRPPQGAPAYNLGVETRLEACGWFVSHRQLMQGTIFHTQPGLELNFTHEGRGTLWLAGRPIPLAPFRAVLFDARLPHQLVLDRAQPYRRSVLCVDPPRLRDLELDWILRGGPHRAILPKPAYARFDELLGMLHAEALGRARGWEDLTRALLVQLMVTLRRFVEAGVREDEAAPGDAGLAQLAAEYAARRLDQPLGLAEVARKFRVSPEHLTRTFRAEFGAPFHRWLLRQRVAAAQALLLEDGSLPLTEAGLRTGFASLSSFSRTFRQLTGLTPTQYRERAGGEA